MEDRAHFIYNGLDSREFSLHIENDIFFSSPEADLEFVDVKGKDGSLAIDNKRLKDATFPIPVRIKETKGKTVNEIATEVSNWLKGDIGWHPLYFSGQPDHEYEAIIYEQFDISETLKNFGRTIITFRIKPTKKNINVDYQEITNGETLDNAGARIAKPLIYIEGTGDITLKNNGKDWVILNGVDNKITIDSERMVVYREKNNNEFDKMNSTLKPMFPLLEKGKNVITWTGNATKVEINPRWEVIS